MDKLNAFISLANIFNNNGYSFYLVGGSVRDFLLFNDLFDLDVVTDATPDEVKSFFLGKATYTFKIYGAVTIHHEGYRFDLTTLRKEEAYDDSRHPSKITFVKNLKDDVLRRDFTLNALYMDKNLKVYDYVNGQEDLQNKVLKMIGDPYVRLKEDPLRILRAIRFSITYDFKIDAKLSQAIIDSVPLLNFLNKDKIKEEIRKMKKSKEELIPIFDEFNIHYLLEL